MEILDIVIGVILLYGLVKGIMKGLLTEVASLVALIAGIYGSMHFSFYAKDLLIKYVDLEPKYIALTAFAITFLVIVISISLAGKLLTKLASLIALGWINKILGAIFGVIKVGLILSVILGWLERINGVIPFLEKEQIEKSILFTPVKNLAPAIFPTLLDKLENNTEKDNGTKSI
ncbi:membrane protein required for colicin V production [Wenyingzhuangia heitensis]|uniref:Membrane protein required for colicin V production n=1 Tax=Wenyingzhuangia heitensis TaxID=1487859 RepID=A0ABX0U9J8_9FLAO|nr:CvpA family protein [Wenyingzhuangia heitensis]NIJ43816.1 membrane protein required for colicin V production [Wenyingzhuangia heitensis]